VAVHHDRPDMVRLLLELGVDPNIRMLGGETPLHNVAYGAGSGRRRFSLKPALT